MLSHLVNTPIIRFEMVKFFRYSMTRIQFINSYCFERMSKFQLEILFYTLYLFRLIIDQNMCLKF